MSEEPTKAVSPLRQRMIDDMRMRKLSDKTQVAYIRAVRRLARFLGRSPDTATAEDVRRFQLHLVDVGMSPISINATITALKFFFEATVGRPELGTKMRPVRVEHKLPVVLSREEVARLIEAAGNLKYRTALSVAYGAGLRASEIVSLKTTDVDSERMTLRIEQGKGHKDRYAMLPPDFQRGDVILFPALLSPDSVAVVFNGQQTFVHQFEVGSFLPLQTVTLDSPISSTQIKASSGAFGPYNGVLLELRQTPSADKFEQLSFSSPIEARSTLSDKLAASPPQALIAELRDLAIGKAVGRYFIANGQKEMVQVARDYMVDLGFAKDLSVFSYNVGEVLAKEFNGDFAGKPTSEVEAWATALLGLLIPVGSNIAVTLGKVYFQQLVEDLFAPLNALLNSIRLGTDGDDTVRGGPNSDFFYQGPGDDRSFGGRRRHLRGWLRAW